MTVLRSSNRRTSAPATNFTASFSDRMCRARHLSHARIRVVFPPAAYRLARSSVGPDAPIAFGAGASRSKVTGEEIRGREPIHSANTRHWHGAAPYNLSSHLAMSEQTDKGEAPPGRTRIGADTTPDQAAR